MKIEIKTVKSEYYSLEGSNGQVFAICNTVDEATRVLNLYRPDYIRENGVRMFHHIDSVIDNPVDCSELV